MKIDQLLYFLEVSKTEHVGKAARALNISPSAVSHSIASLEDEMGHPLFEKTGKFIRITPIGQKLARKAQPLIDELNRLKQELQSETIEPEGHYRIAATHGLLDKYLLPVINKLQKASPKVSFETYSLRSAQVVEEVSFGNLDFGICFAPLSNSRIQIHKIKDQKLSICVSPSNPIAKLKGTELIKALSTTPMASPKAFHGIEVCEDHPALKKAGIASQPKFIYDSYDVACHKIKGSQFWGLVTEIFAEHYGLKQVSLPGFNATTHISLVTPKNRPLDRLTTKLINDLN